MNVFKATFDTLFILACFMLAMLCLGVFLAGLMAWLCLMIAIVVSGGGLILAAWAIEGALVRLGIIEVDV